MSRLKFILLLTLGVVSIAGATSPPPVAQLFAVTFWGSQLLTIDRTLTNVTFVTAESGLNPRLDGLAFDSNGTLYGFRQNQASAYALYVVNQTDGQLTLVGDLGIQFSVGEISRRHGFTDARIFSLLGTIQFVLGSIRALACADRRPRRSGWRSQYSLNGASKVRFSFSAMARKTARVGACTPHFQLNRSGYGEGLPIQGI